MNDLGLPEEPALIGDQLRNARFAGTPWDDPAVEPALATWLWEEWGPTLESAGMDRARFGSALSADRRELWLWVVGERQWNQFASGLAGRLRRRLPNELPSSPSVNAG